MSCSVITVGGSQAHQTFLQLVLGYAVHGDYRQGRRQSQVQKEEASEELEEPAAVCQAGCRDAETTAELDGLQKGQGQ